MLKHKTPMQMLDDSGDYKDFIYHLADSIHSQMLPNKKYDVVDISYFDLAGEKYQGIDDAINVAFALEVLIETGRIKRTYARIDKDKNVISEHENLEEAFKDIGLVEGVDNVLILSERT